MSPFPLHPDPDGSPDLLSPKSWQDSTVWHYTNAAGLAGIIKENVLWASSTAFMNDQHELRTGAEQLKSLIKQHQHYLAPGILADVCSMVRSATAQDRYRTFVTCACKDPNNLTMWRNYTGPEVGFAVGLDTTKPLSMRRQTAMTKEMVDKLGFQDPYDEQEVFDNARRELGSFAWREAIYDTEEQKAIAWGRLLELEKAAVARSNGQQAERHELDVMYDIYGELQTFKNSGFVDEREMRVVCGAGLYTDLIYVKHRPSRYGIVPYVELCLPTDPKIEPSKGPEPVHELPIAGIIGGPTPYPEEAATGARELLRRVGRENIPVIPSKVPFRW
ncbi:DUF2971 domain-containing protein [Arthrobacter sp. GAS37]|uniref:DUF2971 domain-containing protein n=1 Tax=Arthrobacter sp. GAS37 TaxID=3156261 RepID=UPI00384DBFC8